MTFSDARGVEVMREQELAIAKALRDPQVVRQPVQIDWVDNGAGGLEPKIAGAVAYEITPGGSDE
jgi:hypothetical protein